MLVGRLPTNVPCRPGCTEVAPHVCLHGHESVMKVSVRHPLADDGSLPQHLASRSKYVPNVTYTHPLSYNGTHTKPFTPVPVPIPAASSPPHIETTPTGGPLSHLVMRFTIRCEAKSGFLGQTSLSPYLYLLLQRTRVSNASVALALWYVHRLCDLAKPFPREEEICGHCLATTCLMLAEKFLQDGDLPTRRWADAAGWTMKDANRMERQALKALDYNLFVSPETFQEFLQLYKHDPHRILWETQQGQPQAVYR